MKRISDPAMGSFSLATSLKDKGKDITSTTQKFKLRGEAVLGKPKGPLTEVERVGGNETPESDT